MIKKLIGTLVVGMLFAAHANAATISIMGPASVDAGVFQLTIWAADFPSGFGAGGAVVGWDPSLVSFDSAVLEAETADPGLSCGFIGSVACPSNTDPTNTVGFVWGNFFSSIVQAGGPPTLLATLNFTALPGLEVDAVFTLVNLTSVNGGGLWFAPGITGFIDTPDFEGLTVHVNPAVVPLPAAVWFMIGGLGTLLGFRRK